VNANCYDDINEMLSSEYFQHLWKHFNEDSIRECDNNTEYNDISIDIDDIEIKNIAK